MNKPVAWMYQRLGSDKWWVCLGEPSGEVSDRKPLYTHPVKELHLSLQKTEDGELVAVTYTDDEHRIVEVLWERPPVKELNDGGEPVKNATYWKRQYNEMSAANDRLKSGLYHANEQIKYLESHPVKELMDEEQTYKDLYMAVIKQLNKMLGIPEDGDMRFKWIAVELHDVLNELAILRKASEK